MPQSSSSQPISEPLEELMAGYLLNTLTPEAVTEFERQLQADPKIATQFREWQAVMGLLAHTAPPIQAPPTLRADILTAIDQQNHRRTDRRAMPDQAFIPRFATPVWRYWRTLPTVAAALVMIALGIDNYRLHQRLSGIDRTIATLPSAAPNQVETDHETYLFDLKGTPGMRDARGHVTLDLKSARALVVVQNLPPLAAGEAYYLWAFMPDKPILCGQLTPNAQGEMIATLTIPAKEYTRDVVFMRVSIDAATKPTDPYTPKLAMTSES